MTEDEIAAFEQDWADVTGGKYTIDEVAAGNDVQDLYYGYLNDPSILDTLGGALKQFGTSAFNGLKSMYTKDGKVDWKAVAATAGALYGATQGQNKSQPTGYLGGIPRYTAVRSSVPQAMDATRRVPGSAGMRYFSDTQYIPSGGDVAAARTAADTQAAQIQAANTANPNAVTPAPRTVVDTAARPNATTAASGVANLLPVPKYEYAKGGIAGLQYATPYSTYDARDGNDDSSTPAYVYAHGGVAGLAKGRYLAGATDGMADKISTKIDGKQDAALSHGEFVIPADVVSHLGNGNSDAGAQRLYEMMDKVRKARTGTTKQGKQINPNKFLLA